MDGSPPADTGAGPESHLRTFLAARDVSCPACGYNLRDLQTDRCPECGDQLLLRIGLVEPRQGALIAGLVGLAAGLGLGGLLLIYGVIIAFVMRQGPGGLQRFFVVNSVGFAVHAGALGLWIYYWNRIRRLSTPVRRILVLLCAAMPIAFIVVFTAYIR
jgi:hypothetical protein